MKLPGRAKPHHSDQPRRNSGRDACGGIGDARGRLHLRSDSAASTVLRCSTRGSGLELPRNGITVARGQLSRPNDFDECLLDTLAALTFLKGTGHQSAAIIGHSFGGAVAINAGTLSPIATAVIAISSQLAGAHVAGEISHPNRSC